MLRCPYCHVNISTRTEVCPLCHTRLTDVGNSKDDVKHTARAYPPRSDTHTLQGNLFDKIYLYSWLCLSVSFLIAEGVMTKSVKYAWIPISALLYFYILFRLVIRSGEYFPQQVTAHAIILTVVIYTLRSVLPEPVIIFSYLLPTLYLVSTVAIAVFMIINFRRPNRYLLNIITVALMCSIPFIVLMILREDNSFIMALITMVIGLAVIIGTIAAKAKTILSELKRKFHI